MSPVDVDMSELETLLQAHVDRGTVAGAVGLVSRGDDVEVAVVGRARLEDDAPMARDTIVRVASITKPLMAAVTMMLVEDGALALDRQIREWLPEIASPLVVRTPTSPIDDVVPARRAVTVLDVLTSTTGWGFPSDFSHPALIPIVEELRSGPMPATVPAPDDWMAILARTPMLYQPGEAFLYNTGFDLLGVMLARVADRSLTDLLAERVFEPLGMVDTGFFVPAGSLGRFASYYGSDADGHLALLDGPDGQWSRPPAFPSGAGGLVSRIDDWLAFCRLLLGRGEAGGPRLLSPDSVTAMMTNHLTPEQCAPADLFLDGQGWGLGGGVDTTVKDPWNVVGRYGWVGGTGTSAYVTPSTQAGPGTIAILLSQKSMESPVPPQHLFDFWTYAGSSDRAPQTLTPPASGARGSASCAPRPTP